MVDPAAVVEGVGPGVVVVVVTVVVLDGAVPPMVVLDGFGTGVAGVVDGEVVAVVGVLRCAVVVGAAGIT